MLRPSPEMRITSYNPQRFDCTLGIIDGTKASRTVFIYVPLAQLSQHTYFIGG